ncbi:DUF4352 domain-containing protein [Streptococcus danieliae]|uniref:DUF4352 domain-containing protein n=1 Tax=Streptococcus danieliae TaxID=747656 RepID=A0A7Z0LBQ3_9STRE|nr:DUF4352 domain-containing protein [Streptococcus danieliae]MBF0716579.1 DUF4352 domain-containing protein [Streptococcus danieliae]NYS48509.1 DUF4352 domain-containing protein [Streptococcus danieliae]
MSEKKALRSQPYWIWIFSLVGLNLFLLAVVAGLLFSYLGLARDNEQYARLLGLNQKDETVIEQELNKSRQFVTGERVTVKAITRDPEQEMWDDATGTAVVVDLLVENSHAHTFRVNPYSYELFDEEGEPLLLDSVTFDQESLSSNLQPGDQEHYRLVFDGEMGTGPYHLVHYDTQWTSE